MFHHENEPRRRPQAGTTRACKLSVLPGAAAPKSLDSLYLAAGADRATTRRRLGKNRVPDLMKTRALLRRLRLSRLPSCPMKKLTTRRSSTCLKVERGTAGRTQPELAVYDPSNIPSGANARESCTSRPRERYPGPVPRLRVLLHWPVYRTCTHGRAVSTSLWGAIIE